MSRGGGVDMSAGPEAPQWADEQARVEAQLRQRLFGVMASETQLVGPPAPLEGSSSPTTPDGPSRAPPPTSGTTLGRYVVLESAGRGGMGDVLRAYDPKLQREVALKLVRADRLDTDGRARMLREARAMARLSHPNVVTVFDAEESDAGVMLVMEFVAGQTLARWMGGEHRWREIIDAFVAAGRGLAAAHAEGLLHRDFKPANVLVATSGEVKVTDFGLAKVAAAAEPSRSEDGLAPRSAEPLEAALTQSHTVLGTPRYMAPEQYDGGVLGPAADQFSFCVALWEALVGTPPFADARLAEGRRRGPPPWPRGVVVPARIAAAIRRGLAPQPEARWPSVPALLSELQRDWGARRRNALAVGASLLVGAGAWGWQRAEQSRAERACAAEAAQLATVWNEARADAIATAFAATGIAYAADTWARSRRRVDDHALAWAQARAALCEGADVHGTIDAELARAGRDCLDEQGERLTALLAQLAEPDAIVVQKAALATASLPAAGACTDPRALGIRAGRPDDPAAQAQVASLRAALARAAAEQSAGRPGPAHDEIAAVLEQATAIGWSPLVAEAQFALGATATGLGRDEDAAAAYEAAFLAAGAAGRDDLALAAATALTGTLGSGLARHDSGLQWGRIAQMLVDRLGLHGDLALAKLLSMTGNVHEAHGDYAQAQRDYERALAIREPILGGDHPEVAMAITNLGNAYLNHGDHATALSHYERALALWEQALGPAHPDVAVALNNLGNAHYAAGDYAQAVAAHTRALAIRRDALGPEHPDVGASLNNLANAHHALGEHTEAVATHEQALAIWERALGPGHPRVVASLNNLCVAQITRGAHEQAQQYCGRALALAEQVHGPDHRSLAPPLDNLSDLHRTLGHFELARGYAERSLAIKQQTLGPDHPEVAISLVNLGMLADAQGDPAQAIALLERAAQLNLRSKGPDHPHLAGALEALAAVHRGQRDFVAAVTELERALAIRQRGENSPLELATTEFALAQALWDGALERPRARVLALSAGERLHALGPRAVEALGEVDAWLAAHPAADAQASPSVSE